MKKLLVLLLLITGTLLVANAQQDCVRSYNVCISSTPIQSNVLAGYGSVEELKKNAYCFSRTNNVNAENNSMWFTFTTTSAGTLAFEISPVDANDDYDFMLFDVTNAGCQGIVDGILSPARCNFNGYKGITTGLRTGYFDTTAAINGDSFLAPLPVVPNQKFALLVNNFINGGQGFLLDFSTSSTSFLNQEPCGVTVGINDITPNIEFNLYPNPAIGGKFKITSNQLLQGSMQVSIYNTAGEMVFSGPNINAIDLGTAPPGLYLVQISGHGFKKVVRLVVE